MLGDGLPCKLSINTIGKLNNLKYFQIYFDICESGYFNSMRVSVSSYGTQSDPPDDDGDLDRPPPAKRRAKQPDAPQQEPPDCPDPGESADAPRTSRLEGKRHYDGMF